jgi:hypothetical protein
LNHTEPHATFATYAQSASWEARRWRRDHVAIGKSPGDLRGIDDDWSRTLELDHASLEPVEKLPHVRLHRLAE